MKKKIALVIMFFLLGIILVFHILVFTEQIPFDKVWAGRLNSIEEMKSFEAFSIILNVIILAILISKYRLLERKEGNRLIDFAIWIIASFFALNTIGNLFSKNIVELILGTFTTLTSSVLCYVIVKKENKCPTEASN